jgi:hypothetical protein
MNNLGRNFNFDDQTFFKKKETGSNVDSEFNNIVNFINNLLRGFQSFGAFKVGSFGTADGTLYQPLQFPIGGGSSPIGVEFEIYTNTGVTTSAKQIAQVDGGAGIYFILGDDGSGNQFFDIIMSGLNTNTPDTVKQTTTKGTPAARAYSKPSTTNVSVTMGSGTYTTRSFGIDLAPR